MTSQDGGAVFEVNMSNGWVSRVAQVAQVKVLSHIPGLRSAHLSSKFAS